MAYRIDWLQPAIDNLVDLVDAVLPHNPLAAAQLEADLWAAPGPLTTNPRLYKASPYVEGQREIVVRANYIVLYEVDDAQRVVTITALAHARQQR